MTNTLPELRAKRDALHAKGTALRIQYDAVRRELEQITSRIHVAELRDAIGSTVIVKPSVFEPGQSAKLVAVRRTMATIDMSPHGQVECPLAWLSVPAKSNVAENAGQEVGSHG